MRKSLEKLVTEEPLKGLVLDLRNNPGGVLRSSVDVAGLFMEGGTVVYTEGRLANSDINYAATPEDNSEGVPLIVLINGGSASASEIVAGALQDHSRAIIMGTPSFGKGSVQTVLPISESRAVKLTTALYFTPNGRSIQAEGIEPDVFVERAQVKTLSEAGRISEADLSGHLGNGNGRERNSQSRSSGLLSTDNQLYEALTLLKGINVLGLRDTASTDIEPLADAPTLVLIIDDIGHRLDTGRASVQLPGRINLAVLPFTPHAAQLAEDGFASGKEIMLHVPMSSQVARDTEPEPLTADLAEPDFRALLVRQLDAVPHVRGVNNHMGSDLTRQHEAMAWLMSELVRRDLYFIDSRTTADTVAADSACIP